MLCQHGRGVVCHECHDTIGRLCADLNAANAEITRLRAELAEARAERDEARTSNGMYGTQLRRAGADLAKAEAARDVAEFAYSGALAELSDALGSKHLTMASAIAYVRGRVAELARERDARPDISPESANAVVDWWDSDNAPSTADVCAAIAILRAHAARATKGGE